MWGIFKNCQFNFLNDVRIIEIFYFIFGKLLWLVFLNNWLISSVLSNLYVTFLFDVCSDTFYSFQILVICDFFPFSFVSLDRSLSVLIFLKSQGLYHWFSLLFFLFSLISALKLIVSFLLLALGLFCFSFSTFLWWDLRLLI